MKFEDEGYIIKLRRHGEKSLILTVLTRNYGKITGYVKNCLNKKNLGIYQLGNKVNIEGYTRIEENMWSFHVELNRAYSVNFMTSKKKLSALSAFCSLCNDVMPERQNIENLYIHVDNFFNQIHQDNWLTYYCYFEFYLMSFLGLSLDLEKCSVTGCYDNLRYISPRTGKAVCAEIGQPYHQRLYDYPKFIVDNNYLPKNKEVKGLLRMTEFFLHKNFFKTHYLKFPTNRANLLDNLDLD